MPFEETIDQYVGRSSFRSDTDFILSNLKEVFEAYKQLSGMKINMGSATSTAGIAAEAKKLNKERSQAVKINEQLSRSELNAAKAAKEQALAEKALAQARKENATAAEKEAKATAATGKAQRVNQKVIDDAIDDYLQLSRAYNEAARKYKNYALTLGESHPTTVQALKDANDMGAVLKRLDANVGQHQRNVGNYKSAFDGLGFSFTQISRELPSLAVNFQQFALAISNNLPMAADELKKAAAEIKALKAEGKEAPSLLSKIGNAIFSWQVGLSVGIALFTAYGKEIGNFFSKLFGSKAIIDETAAAQRVLNQTLGEGNSQYADAVKNVNELQINISLAKRGFLDKDAVVKQYNETIGKTTGHVNNLDQAERALAKNADAFIKFTLLKAAAQEALGEASKLALERQKEVLNTEGTTDFILTGTRGLEEAKKNSKEFQEISEKAIEELKSLGKVSDETRRKQTAIEKSLTESLIAPELSGQQQQFEDIAKKFQQQAAEIAKEFKFNFFGDPEKAKSDNKRFFDEALKDLADGYKAVSEAQDLLGRTRIEARRRSAELEQQILEGQTQVEIANANGNADEIAFIQQKAAFRRKKIEEQLQIDLTIIRADAAKRQRDMDVELNKQFEQDMKERTERELHAVIERQEKKAVALRDDQATEIELLNETYNKRLAATRGNQKAREKVDKEYAERRAEIEYRYARFAVLNEISLAEQILAIKKASGQDVTKETEQLAALRIKLSDIETKHLLDNEKFATDKRIENLHKLERAIVRIKDVFSEVNNFVNGMISAFTDRQKNAIQDQIDALDAQKQKEIEVANQTITNEQDKAAAIAIINARAQAKKEQLELRQRQLDIQRARFEKAANIGRIIIETALAVVHQLGSGDPFTAVPRAIAAGIIGAGQLAVAIAQPIPKFKHGRDHGPATLGVVNDGGKQEVIASPDLSQSYLPGGTNTITYLPKDWKVFPDVDSFLATAQKMAMAGTVARPVAVNQNGELIWTMKQEIRSLRAAVMGRTEHHTYIDNGEVVNMVKKGNSTLRYIQDNLG